MVGTGVLPYYVGLVGIVAAVSGVLSAVFVVLANSWMKAGFDVINGPLVNIQSEKQLRDLEDKLSADQKQAVEDAISSLA